MTDRPGDGGWAAPDDPWAPPHFYEQPPPFQPPVIYPPAAPPAQQEMPYVPSPLPAQQRPQPQPQQPQAPDPYAGASPGYGAPPPPPPPAWAYPGPVPPRGSRAHRDPWTLKGWRGGGSVVVRLLVALAALVLPFAVLCVGWIAEERAFDRYEQETYAPVRGVVTLDESDQQHFVGSSPSAGDIRIPLGYDWDTAYYEGDRITVLVAPDDPRDYLLPDDQAAPEMAVGFLVALTAVCLVALTAAVLVHRARWGTTDMVRQVAARPPATQPAPLGSQPPARVRQLAGRLAVAALLGLAAAAAIRASVWPVTEEQPAVRRETGIVFNGSDGQGRPALEVRYFDSRQNGDNHRPLTPTELAGARAGDVITVTYRDGEPVFDDGDRAGFAALGAALALAAFAVAWRPVAYHVRLRRAVREPARAADVVAWVRVVRGRTWLVVSPRGATHVHDAVAVPLLGEHEMPAAIDGVIHLHGRLRGGYPVVLRDPGGGALWPSGPARGSLWADATFVPAGPPSPPATPRWYPPPAWPQYTGA